jgi:hypothetical protein
MNSPKLFVGEDLLFADTREILECQSNRVSCALRLYEQLAAKLGLVGSTTECPDVTTKMKELDHCARAHCISHSGSRRDSIRLSENFALKSSYSDRQCSRRFADRSKDCVSRARNIEKCRSPRLNDRLIGFRHAATKTISGSGILIKIGVNARLC